MILQAPTGSYLPVLPKGPDDPTSVIYTISAGPPPRSVVSFPKIPDGIRDLRKSARVFTDNERRVTRGDLVFTTKMANPVKVGGGSRLFGYGQILEFEENPGTTVTAAPVSSEVITKHNNNYIDTTDLGLDTDDQMELAEQAVAAQRLILGEIGDFQKQRQSLEVDIRDLQGQTNEAKKVLSGLAAIKAAGRDVLILEGKITIKLAELSSRLTAAVELYNVIPQKIADLRDNLMTLANLVK